MATKEALVQEYRRDTILGAARHVIARKGVAGASMQAIARKAGVAKGTLYLYFRDRGELIERSASGIFDELFARFEAVLATRRPLRETLHALVRTKLELFDEHQEFLRVYMELSSKDGGACARRGPGAQRARSVQLLSDYLAGAKRRGEMKPFDPERVALFVAEGTSAILRRRLEARGKKTTEEVEWIVDLLLDGLGTRRRS